MGKRTGKQKELTFSANILISLLAGVDLLPRPFESKTHYTKRLFSNKADYSVYHVLLNRLEKRGLITLYKEKNISVPALTEEGKLEALFIKARIPEANKWDGKWRMVLFDIPENAKKQRNKLRFLLKQNGFLQVQKSVYINPYPLNQEAIIYLQDTKLDQYIRIFRIDMADNEKELKKKFSLT